MTPKIKNIIPNINNITIGIANPKIPLFIEAPPVAADKGKTKNKIKIIHNVKDIFDIKDILPSFLLKFDLSLYKRQYIIFLL